MFKLSANAGSELTQQMSQSIPILAVPCWVPIDLSVRVGSQGVIRMSPAEFIRPKQPILGCVNERLSSDGHARNKWPHSRTIKLNLPYSANSPAQQGGTARILEGGASGSPIRERCQSGWKKWGERPLL